MLRAWYGYCIENRCVAFTYFPSKEKTKIHFTSSPKGCPHLLIYTSLYPVMFNNLITQSNEKKSITTVLNQDSVIGLGNRFAQSH